MKDKSKNQNQIYFLKSYIELFLIFHLFNCTFSELLLNKIIRFGSLNFRFCHFSFNSDGEMIADTTSYPLSPGRQFFGIKRNGHFAFKDEFNEETPFYSMTVDHTSGRIEGESSFIKLTSTNNNIHGKELILGISKNYPDKTQGIYMELYNLNDKSLRKYETSNALGYIVTDSFALIKTPDESETIYYYTLTYIISNENDGYYLTLKKTYFSYDVGNGCNHVQQAEALQVSNHRMVSCFYTVNLLYICFYYSLDRKLKAKVYNSDLSSLSSYETTVYSPSSYSEKYFFKSIHFKGEIGFYIYFFQNNNYYLKFSILHCNED